MSDIIGKPAVVPAVGNDKIWGDFPMIEVRRTTSEDAAVLFAIQKEAFLPLYERYHDAGNPYLRGIEDIAARLTHPAFRYFTIL